MFIRHIRDHVAALTMALLLMPAIAAAQIRQVELYVDKPSQSSSNENPFTLQMLNIGGNPIANETIHVKDIDANMSANQKAERIAEAINSTLNPGGEKANDVAIVIGGFGTHGVNIKRPGVRVVSDPTKEGLDRLNARGIQNGRVKLGPAPASGMNATGKQSIARAGLWPDGVATVHPAAGMSSGAVLAELKNKLDKLGVDCELIGDELVFTGIISSRHLVFGNTDTGLENEAELLMTSNPIPTVSEWGMITFGLLLLAGGTIVVRRFRYEASATLEEA